MKNIPLFATGTIAFGVVSILCLLVLHVVSTEFKPNFRMVSEYALGKHKWLLTIFFFCWGLCSISSGFMLWNVVTSGWAKVGVPFLPMGALLIAYHLVKKAE